MLSPCPTLSVLTVIMSLIRGALKLVSSSLSLSPTQMSRHNLFASLSCCWERTSIFLRRALYLEGCFFAYVFSLRLYLEG